MQTTLRLLRWVMPLAVITLTACNAPGLADMNATAAPPADQTGGGATAPAGGEVALVTYIVDGDTIDVSIGGFTYRVRYIGVNTPETDQPCGDEATAANSALVAGQAVTMVKDVSEVDQYNRLLRYVYVGELFINAELVRQGWAEAAAYPPDTAYAATFADLEDAARIQGLGCWPSGVFGP